ncbi:PQQ-binding-like beta-propeller repeat protein [Naumannella halotolerans]|uniref:outer membrane protein assembly factor BamB family protein n=1 Tax=Naumannella halotolerans TaxID=993414 RepID=UPI00370D4BE7
MPWRGHLSARRLRWHGYLPDPRRTSADAGGDAALAPMVVVSVLVVLALLLTAIAVAIPPRTGSIAGTALALAGGPEGSRTVLRGEGQVGGSLLGVESVPVSGFVPHQRGPAGWSNVDGLGQGNWVIENWHGDDRRELLFRADETGLSVASLARGSDAVSFQPPRPDLPAGTVAGQSWTAAGTALISDGLQVIGEVPYSFRGTATALAGDCLRFDYETTIGEDRESSVITRCPDRGVVAIGVGDRTYSESPAVPGRAEALTTADPQRPAGAPDELQVRSLRPVRADLDITGVSTLGAVAELPSGQLAVASDVDGSVLLCTPVADRCERDWQAYPGGSLMQAGVFGDVVVTATSNRELTAYDPDGIWLWTVPTPDIVTTLTRYDDEHLLATTLGGDLVMHRIADGGPGWRNRGTEPITGAPVVLGDGAVAVTDRTGELRLIEPDGSVRWTEAAEVTDGVVASGELLITGTAESLVARSAATAEVVWRRRAVDHQGRTAAGPVVVLHTEQVGLRGIEATTGRDLWSVPAPVRSLATDGAEIFVTGTNEQLLLGADGRELARWSQTVVASSMTPVASLGAGGGYLVNDNSSTITLWQRP